MTLSCCNDPIVQDVEEKEEKEKEERDKRAKSNKDTVKDGGDKSVLRRVRVLNDWIRERYR